MHICKGFLSQGITIDGQILTCIVYLKTLVSLMAIEDTEVMNTTFSKIVNFKISVSQVFILQRNSVCHKSLYR